MICVWPNVPCYVYGGMCHDMCMVACAMLCVWWYVSCYLYGGICHVI